MSYILLRLLFNGLALLIAATLLTGISFESQWSVFAAAVVVGLVNAVLRPILVVLTFPLTVVTLGLFLFILNALLIQLSAWLVPGFYVSGFWSALVASLMLSLVSFVGTRFLASRSQPDL